MTSTRWAIAALFAAAPLTASAQMPTIGVSVDASLLLGLGISVGTAVGDRFNVRGSYHGFSYSDDFDDSEDKLSYDADLKLSSFGVLGDWHPFKGGFRVTAGLMANGNRLDLAAQDNGGEFEVGDCTYRSVANDPLNINGRIDWRDTAPYLGIGWGGNMNAKPGLYGVFDLGVMFSGAPKARLSANGQAQLQSGPGSCGEPGTQFDVNDPNDAAAQQFRNELQTSQDDANEEAKDFKIWPNIAVGIGWRF